MKKLVSAFTILGFLVVVLFASSTFMGCRGPMMVERYQDIKPNETAYVIKMEGAVGEQVKFDSAAQYEAMKVPMKRVPIPQRKIKTGRRWWQYKWISTVEIVIVSREPESREWTQDPKTGTGPEDEALHMESKDGVNFYTGVVVTASILEEDTSTFLYSYPAGALSAVLDRNVRNTAQEELAAAFGLLDQTECNDTKSAVFAKVKKTIVDMYKLKGITITTLGQQGGFMFLDKSIQTALSAKFAAEIDAKTAVEEKAAQVTRNDMAEAKATSDALVAEEYAKQQKAQQEIKRLEIDMVIADALLLNAQKFAIVPQIVGGEAGGMVLQVLQGKTASESQ